MAKKKVIDIKVLNETVGQHKRKRRDSLLLPIKIRGRRLMLSPKYDNTDDTEIKNANLTSQELVAVLKYADEQQEKGAK